jgi:hypothetical protein
MKNDIVLTPNHESIHANSSKEPFVLLVDSRDRNMELYPNSNNYVIQIPRYRDVLSVELVAADIPHTGFNIDKDCNILYLVTDQNMFREYYNGTRVNGLSYIEVVIPPGYYEANDLVSTAGSDVTYKFYYDTIGQSYKWNTGVIAKALNLATGLNFAVLFNIKTLKFIIISDSYYSIVTREMDMDNNLIRPTFFQNGVIAQRADSVLGANNNRFKPLKNGLYSIVGLDMKNYHPYNNTYSYIGAELVDGAYGTAGSVELAKGENYYFPNPYPVTATSPYDPSNPCDVTQTGLPIVPSAVGAGSFVVYSVPFRANLTGEKYVILDIQELNYRDITNEANYQYYSRILFDTGLNITTTLFPNVTNLASVNTVKHIKSSDIGNNRCIKYFTPSQGVLSKLTIKWLKHDGTPYDFQGQDHTLTFEIITVKQTATYFN